MPSEPNSPIGPVGARPPDRLDGVTVFVEVVRAGGFSRAAEQLGLTRSAVGKAIGRLEARLETRLFHRTTRALSLTDDGRVYHDHCVRALAELQAAEAQLESGRLEVAGRLRVTMPVLFGRHCVAPVLLGLARQHPRLELQLNFSDRPVDVLAEGFDLAIRSGVLGAESEGLRARKLVDQPKVVCASPTYLADPGWRRIWPDTASCCTGAASTSTPGACRTRPGAPSTCRCPRGCCWTIWRRWPMPPPPAWAWRGCRSGWCASACAAARSSLCWKNRRAR